MSTATKPRRTNVSTKVKFVGEDHSEFVMHLADADEKSEAAAKLTAMVGHRITLEHLPTATFENEPGDGPSLGHIFAAHIDDGPDDGKEDFGDSFHVTIDDRMGCIRDQFIRELRRIAKVFEGMARLVERRVQPHEAYHVKLGSYPRPIMDDAALRRESESEAGNA